MSDPFLRLTRALADPAATAQLVAERPGTGGRRAAVLILLAEPDGAPEPGVEIVLVEKSAALRSHAGQLAFPGGAIEPGDASPVAAALREAEEEVGVTAGEVEVLGVLPAAHVRASGFDVTAVVARWRQPRQLVPIDTGEVAAVHHLSLDALIEPANRSTWTHPAGFRGPAFTVGDLYIWGFTAHLLDGLIVLAGWGRQWDRLRITEIPERFLRGRRWS